MTRRFHFATCVTISDAELDVELSYTMAWGSAGTGRPYFGAPEHYDPGAPDVAEDIAVDLIDGKPRPWERGVSDEQLATLILDQIDIADLETAALEICAEEDLERGAA